MIGLGFTGAFGDRREGFLLSTRIREVDLWIGLAPDDHKEEESPRRPLSRFTLVGERRNKLEEMR